MEPFSVKHEYEPPYDKNNPDLKTCNPGRMVHVTHSLPPQQVDEGAEVVFTYDVIFQVRRWGLGLGLGCEQSWAGLAGGLMVIMAATPAGACHHHQPIGQPSRGCCFCSCC